MTQPALFGLKNSNRDFAFTRLFVNVAKAELKSENKITRQLRSVIWLFKMLFDFSKHQKININQSNQLLVY